MEGPVKSPMEAPVGGPCGRPHGRPFGRPYWRAFWRAVEGSMEGHVEGPTTQCLSDVVEALDSAMRRAAWAKRSVASWFSFVLVLKL